MDSLEYIQAVNLRIVTIHRQNVEVKKVDDKKHQLANVEGDKGSREKRLNCTKGWEDVTLNRKLGQKDRRSKVINAN